MSKKKIYKNGRNKDFKGTFTMLRHDITKSKAWLALRATEKAILIQIWLRLSIDESNNGKILASHRELAKECHISRPTVSKTIERLEQVGFIEVISKGTFNCKQRLASEFRLTFFKCHATGKLPTNDWRLYDPKKVFDDDLNQYQDE